MTAAAERRELTKPAPIEMAVLVGIIGASRYTPISVNFSYFNPNKCRESAIFIERRMELMLKSGLVLLLERVHVAFLLKRT